MTATLPLRSHDGRLGDITRGVAAALTLLLFVIGVPIALLALAPMYVPDTRPTWDGVAAILTSPDDGTLFLAVLAAIAWIAWAVFTTGVAVELAAGARRMTAPRLPLIGGAQHAASRLIATAGLLIAVSSTTVAHAQPAHATTPTAVAARPTVPPERTPSPQVSAEPEAPHATLSQPAPALPVVTVQRGDTLWGIAERHLGAGPRYTEIRDLNAGRPQPDGRTLVDADWILPGWQLLLPADATGTEQVPPPARRGAQPDSTTSVTVQRGDTLWAIAAEHLGDGHRYVEIADLNRGRIQPDGDSLTDAALIRPGWVLLLPPHAPLATRPVAPVEEPQLANEPRDVARGSGATGPDVDAAPDSALTPPPPTARPEPDTEAALAPQMETEKRPELSTGAQTNEASEEADDSSIQAWFLGLSALAAIGIAGELTRRRNVQQRARRLGEGIPMPDPSSAAARAERSLRSAAPPMTITAITTALSNLGCRCFDAGRDLPRVGALLLDEHNLTLLLLEDDPQPIEPFTATDPRTWVATNSDIATDQPIEDPDRCAPYPLLVTLGHTERGTLIANLEAAGTLSIIGEDQVADDILRALVVEAATSDLSGQLCVCLEPGDELAALASAFEPHRLSVRQADDERATTTQAVARHLADRGIDDSLQARGDRAAPDTWLPVTFVERTVTANACEPWAGGALVSRHQPHEGTGWVIEADEAGRATLRPLNIAFRPQRLRQEQVADLHALLEISLPPSPTAGESTELVPVDYELQTLRTAYATPPQTSAATPDLTIRVLGPIEIEGLPATKEALSPRMTELLVYLALHGPTTGADLDDVLWNGTRIDPGTRNALLYRTRRRVGRAVLPLADSDGRYRLGDGATTDWAQFQRVLADGSDPGSQQTVEKLSAALDLVRDRPFRGIGAAEYAWADYDIQHMIGAIADAAAVLARLHHEAGRHREALATALKALHVAPYSESLQAIALSAAAATGGSQEVAQLRARFAALLGDLDPELSL